LDEEFNFLHYFIEIWKEAKDVRKLEQFSDSLFDHIVYCKLFEMLAERSDYFQLYFLIPLVEYFETNESMIVSEIIC